MKDFTGMVCRIFSWYALASVLAAVLLFLIFLAQTHEELKGFCSEEQKCLMYEELLEAPCCLERGPGEVLDTYVFENEQDVMRGEKQND